MASLKGKVIAITGAASGIGLELARIAAARGASLALADIQKEALDKVVAELQSAEVKAYGTRLDVSSSQQVDDWIASVIDHFRKLDGAANIAGIEGENGGFGKLTELSDEEWDQIMSVNLSGLMYCLRAQLRVMDRGASIVNAASIVGLIGRPGMSAYAVSKHGVVGLTKTAAKEAGERGIRVNAFAPGSIETPMLERVFNAEGRENHSYSAPLGRNGQPEEVAKVAAFLLSDDASYVSGAIYLVDGALIA